MHGLIWLGTVALLQAPPATRTHEPPALAPASRIRITDLDSSRSRRRSGTLIATRGDTLVLHVDGARDTTAVPLAAISILEVSRGRHGHAGAGLGYGFLAGAGTGAILGALACSSESCDGGSGDDMTGPVIVVAAGLGGAVGGLIGVIVGASHQTDRWEAIDKNRWHVGLAPTGAGGFIFSLSLQL